MNQHVKIVLPCTNEGEWLRVTVDSILEHTDFPSFELFVMANGDTLTDFSFIEKPAYRRHVRLKRVEERLGVGNSINEAVVPGDAHYYIFLDAHCLLEQDDWLERAIESIENHPRASMIHPAVLHFTYEGVVEPEGAIESDDVSHEYWEYFIRWQWPSGRDLNLVDVQTQALSQAPHEGMAAGAMAVFVRADTFHSLGRYDPEVSGWYLEGMDYCIRSWLLGYPMIVDPTVRVLHRQVETRRLDEMRLVDMVHGALRTAFKYFNPRRRELLEVLFRRYGPDGLVDRAIERIRRGRWVEERASHLRSRVHDDDWLFARFRIYEERF